MRRYALFALGITLLPAPGLAELKPEEQIKYRQSGYTFMRWNLLKIKAQVIDEPETFDASAVAAAADAIAAIANSGMGALFGPGTQTGTGWKKTRVRPEFFERPEEVGEYAQAFKIEANELARVAASGDPVRIEAQFTRLHKSCKACHQEFRYKK